MRSVKDERDLASEKEVGGVEGYSRQVGSNFSAASAIGG